MSLLRGLRCSLFAGLAASAAWSVVALISDSEFGVGPIFAGVAAGLGMAIGNEARDGQLAGRWAVACGVSSSIGVFMGLSLVEGRHQSLNPFQAVVDMGATGVMALLVGSCAAWFFGSRETGLSTMLAQRRVVQRVHHALEGPLGALSRDVDKHKAEVLRKAA